MVRRNGTKTLRRILFVLLLSSLAYVGRAHTFSVTHAATTTSNVAYVTDFGSGVNDTAGPGSGSSIFVNAVTGSTIGSGGTGTYNGASFTNVPLSTLNANPTTALSGYDTVILYELCSIGNPGNATAVNAINNFLTAGNHKVLLFDADGCSTSGLGAQAVYNGSSGGSTFLFPFATNAPGPQGAQSSYNFVEPSGLTTGLAGYADSSGEDALGDANIFQGPRSVGWCAALKATNVNGANDIVEAYARTVNGSLAVYSGEDLWFTFGPTAHLKQVFDNVLAQPFGVNPDGTPADGLPCTLPPSGIKLDPVNATNDLGTPHTDTATVVDSNGGPQSGITVNFTVISGPDAGLTGTGVTDGSGHATFTFTDNTAPGTDVVVATFTDSTGILETSNQAAKTWIAIPTTLTYNGETSQDLNDLATLSAILRDSNGTPIAGQTVSFSLNGSETCTGTTAGNGQASCSVTPGEVAGNYTVSASFAGSGKYLPSSTSSPFTVRLEEAQLTSTASLQLFAQGHSAALSAVLTDPDGGAPIKGKPVVLTLGSGSSAQSCTGTTDATGTASCSINAVTVPLGPQPVTDSFAGDAYYKAATNSQKALLFAYLASGSFALGDLGTSTPPTWWGAQWAKLNSLTYGPAPSAFKGFASTLAPAQLTCGGTWTTTPGNSPPPPAASSIPSYMAVLVTSKVTQSGSTISGNIAKIVVVNTAPGYQPDPGHSGTGTVVAQVC